VALDHLVDLGIQPAGVAELHRRRAAQVRQQQLQELGVPLLAGRELQQDRAGAVRQRFHPGAEVGGCRGLGKGRRRIGQRPLRLEAEPEPTRRLPDPARQGGVAGKPPKGVVDLDRVEPGRVLGQEAAGR